MRFRKDAEQTNSKFYEILKIPAAGSKFRDLELPQARERALEVYNYPRRYSR